MDDKPAASAQEDHDAETLRPISARQMMLSGKPFYSADQQLTVDRMACLELLQQYNTTLAVGDAAGRLLVLKQLLGSLDEGRPPQIVHPFYCDYGYNIHVGKDFYANFACTILDCGRVDIGDRVLLGPNCQIYTVSHLLECDDRDGPNGPEFTKPVVIEDDVWLGGAVIVCPGVTIGQGSTVAAGSVVTKDVEPYSLVAGNPARFLRRLERTARGVGQQGQEWGRGNSLRGRE